MKNNLLPPNQKIFTTSVTNAEGVCYCINFLAPSADVAAVLNNAMRGHPEYWGELTWIGDVVEDGPITEWSNDENSD